MSTCVWHEAHLVFVHPLGLVNLDAIQFSRPPRKVRSSTPWASPFSFASWTPIVARQSLQRRSQHWHHVSRRLVPNEGHGASLLLGVQEKCVRIGFSSCTGSFAALLRDLYHRGKLNLCHRLAAHWTYRSFMHRSVQNKTGTSIAKVRVSARHHLGVHVVLKADDALHDGRLVVGCCGNLRRDVLLPFMIL